MVHITTYRAAVDKTAYPINECGKELVFELRTPEKYHSNQINSILHMPTNRTRTKSDYIPHEIKSVKPNQACTCSQIQI